MSDVELERRIILERKDAGRKALGKAIDEIGRLAGNEIYRKAWKKACAKIASLMECESF